MSAEREVMAVGLAAGPDGVQISCYASHMKEPVTLALNGEEEHFAIEMPESVWAEALGTKEETGALSEYLKSVLEKAGADVQKKELHVMAAIPSMEKPLWENMRTALEKAGVERRNIYIQDHLSAFYYYAVNQRKELWNADTALLEYCDGEMVGYVLTIDRTKAPALVRVEETARREIRESMRDGRDDEAWAKEKDRLFFEFLKKVFERRNVTTVYLLSDYFDKSWAKKSFDFLCFRRHAFQGQNLYTKGACYAAMERMGQLRMPDMLYLGTDIIRNNLSMKLRIRGREQNVPLISAGINWYEAHFECEMIPEGDMTVTMVSTPMAGGPEISHVLRLDKIPDRPDRATRLKMSLYYTSPDTCEVEIEDLGFGDMFRSSGRRWKRKISF